MVSVSENAREEVWHSLSEGLGRQIFATILLTVSTIISLSMPQLSGYASPVWLPAGVSVALVLIWGAGIWPSILAYALITEVILLGFKPDLMLDHVGAAVCLGAIKCLAPILTIGLLRRHADGPVPLLTLREFLLFAPIGIVGTAFLVATGGTLNAWVWDLLGDQTVLRTWVVWMIGDTVGILFTAPAVANWLAPANARAEPRARDEQRAEFIVLLLALIVSVTIFVGMMPGLEMLAGRPVTVLGLILWSVLRLAPRYNSAFALLTVLALSAALAYRPDVAPQFAFAVPLFGAPRLEEIFGLQINLGLMVFAGFLINALMAERLVQMRALEAANTTLEHRVAERTRDLSESEGRLRSITDAMQDAIILIDTDGRIAFWNPAATRLFGYRAEEVTRLGGYEVLLPPAFRPKVEEELARFRMTGEGPAPGSAYEFLALHKDGTERPVEMTAAAMRRPDGFAAAVVVRDVTERKQAYDLLQKEKERADALLGNILPRSVIERLNAGETAISDHAQDASILFCDIVGFTRLCTTISADRAVEILNTLFSRFDDLVRATGAEKIKTMGDGYMVAAGVPDPYPDHAASLAGLGLDLVSATRDLARDLDVPLKLRVGIHTGDVVAGVIGKDKFVFDVWGDTVNVASHIESCAEPDVVCVSTVTAERLQGRFRLGVPIMADAKGRGALRMFPVLTKEC